MDGDGERESGEPFQFKNVKCDFIVDLEQRQTSVLDFSPWIALDLKTNHL